jgi:hypothetical protein
MHPLLKMDMGLVDFEHLPSIHSQMQFRYLGTIATIAAIVAAAGSVASTAYAATQSGPTLPNGASSSRRVARATAAALPVQRGISAAEQQGGQYSTWVPGHNEPQQFVKVPIDDNMGSSLGDFGSRQEQATHSAGPFAFTPGAELFGIGDSGPQYKYIPYNAADWQEGGKYANSQFAKGPNAPGSDAWMRAHVVTKGQHIPGQNKTYDFKGYGTADIQGELARQMADVQERLGAKYGTQFAQEARHEAELADPEGFAARGKELEMIQHEIDNPLPVNPMAETLDQRNLERLKAGSGLDAMSTDLLDSAIARANAARGGNTVAGDVAHEMSTGMEGAARRQAGIGEAQQYLTSGATPDDVKYRRNQQILADLSAFVNGQTPESQFHSISGAGNGATPFSPGNAGPQATSGAAEAAPGFSVAAWQQNLHNQSAQANPWMAGLSSLLSGIGAFGQTPAGGTH